MLLSLIQAEHLFEDDTHQVAHKRQRVFFVPEEQPTSDMGVSSLFGLEGVALSLEIRLLFSLVLAGVASGLVVLVRRLRRRLAKTYIPIVVDLATSVIVVGIVVGTTLVLADLWGHTETLRDQIGFLSLDKHASEVIISLVVLIAVQVFAGVVARLLDSLVTEQEVLNHHQREVTLRISQVILWGTAALLILGIWNIDLTGLLVGAGFLGIVVGMAARKTLGSLLGGVVLMLSRPFEVGDWVVIDEKTGIVSDITLMSTRIQGFDGEYIVVPNDVVTNKTITNRSRQGRLRVAVEVGVDYSTDTDRAREVITEAVDSIQTDNEFVRASPPPNVVVRTFGDSAIIFEAAVWINEPTTRRVMHTEDRLVSAINTACRDNDIKIPYPQRELTGREPHDGVVRDNPTEK
ncbi:mechanosensitive ion channel family protein [Halovenus rubra]|uniref:Mechanosensitive ion channel family protein n=2 Tax=Halovenus rubra TaxID=869890 RepID=A0ABD5X9I5_9EURY|nr:mechanosensitive ion channel family protein [Halovenus rubra]